LLNQIGLSLGLSVICPQVSRQDTSTRLRFSTVDKAPNSHFWLGVAVTRSIQSRKLATPVRVSTWMGDCLRAGKPSQYVTSRLGQLSLPSLRGG